MFYRKDDEQVTQILLLLFLISLASGALILAYELAFNLYVHVIRDELLMVFRELYFVFEYMLYFFQLAVLIFPDNNS